MLINRKGSSLIMVLIIMTCAIILGTSVLAITSSYVDVSNLNNEATGAYYAAESGIERSSAIIKKRMKERIKAIVDMYENTTDTSIDSTIIKSKIHEVAIKDYFNIVPPVAGSYPEQPELETNFFLDIAPHSGLDGSDKDLIDGRLVYYDDINPNNISVTEISGGVKVSISATGHYNKSVRSIFATYNINDDYSVICSKWE